MRIVQFRTVTGPNIFHHKPVLMMRLDLEELTKRESHEFDGFVLRLLNRFPGLREHHCAAGKPGGFVERLEGGTFFGHIVEHVALEMTAAAGIPVNYGKTVWAGRDGLYDIVVRFEAE